MPHLLMWVMRKMHFCIITILGPKVLSLLKFIKRVSTGKLKEYSLKDFPFEKEIDKNGGINRRPQIESIYSGTNRTKEPISTKGPRISSELS